jgi:hypothetical protein
VTDIQRALRHDLIDAPVPVRVWRDARSVSLSVVPRELG